MYIKKTKYQTFKAAAIEASNRASTQAQAAVAAEHAAAAATETAAMNKDKMIQMRTSEKTFKERSVRRLEKLRAAATE